MISFRLPLASSAETKITRLAQLLLSHDDRLDKFLVATPFGVRIRSYPIAPGWPKNALGLEYPSTDVDGEKRGRG